MLRKCCFCVDLKTGGIIIARFFILRSVISIIDSILSLSKPPTKEEKEMFITWIKIIASIELVLDIIQGVTSVILLLGIQKSRPQLVRIWLIVIPILTVFDAILYWSFDVEDTSILYLSGFIFHYGLIAYFYYVIYSLYKENEM